MASKKNLKKDLNFLTEEVIETCLLHYYLKQENQDEKARIDAIIDETIALRNELFNKINHPEGDLKGKALKAWYADIISQMMKKTDEAFEKLGSLDK